MVEEADEEIAMELFCHCKMNKKKMCQTYCLQEEIDCVNVEFAIIWVVCRFETHMVGLGQDRPVVFQKPARVCVEV